MLLDEATVRRKQSVDFTLDTIRSLSKYKQVCEQVFGPDVCVAPLFILDKDPALTISFDFKDESGRSLSLMTSEENGKISAATLRVIAKERLAAQNLTLTDSLAEKLDKLAESDATEGREWLHRLEEPLPWDADQAEVECLFGDPEARWWLATLAYASLILVSFEESPNHRRVIKIAYDQPLSRTPRPFSKLALRSFKVWLATHLIRSGRYQFDVSAPPDCRLTQVALGDSKENEGLRAPGRNRAHLYIDDVHDARGAVAMFGLRVSGRGVLAGSLVASLLAFGAIVASIKCSTAIAEDAGNGATLLLVLPGLIATYVARSDRHVLTTRLLSWPRWILLFGSGITTYYAAGVIALIGPVEENLSRHMHHKVAAEHAASIEHWLTYAWPPALLTVLVIFAGWFLTREVPHRVRHWVSRTWWRHTRARFKVDVTFQAPVDVVWDHVVSETEKLLDGEWLRDSEWDIAGRESTLYRRFGRFNWTHGIRVREAAAGTAVRWIYWASGPRWTKPVLWMLTGFERIIAAYRIRTFRRVNAT